VGFPLGIDRGVMSGSVCEYQKEGAIRFGANRAGRFDLAWVLIWLMFYGSCL
jgi:hypothetical protein